MFYFLGLAITVTGRQRGGGEAFDCTWDFLIRELPLLLVYEVQFIKSFSLFWDDGDVSSDFVIFSFLVLTYFSPPPNLWRLLLQNWSFPKISTSVFTDFPAPSIGFVSNCALIYHVSFLCSAFSHSGEAFWGGHVCFLAPRPLLSFPLFWTGSSELGCLFIYLDIIWSLQFSLSHS